LLWIGDSVSALDQLGSILEDSLNEYDVFPAAVSGRFDPFLINVINTLLLDRERLEESLKTVLADALSINLTQRF